MSGTRYILVTGGAGYVGTHVIVELLSEGFTPLALDNRELALTEAVERIFEITNVRVQYEVADLQDKASLDSIFRKYRIHYVLHLAGLKAVRESHHCPLLYYQVNVLGSINLLQAMAEHGVYNIIFSSSSKVYGVPKYLPLDEEHPTGLCTNPYGRTKYMVEQILQDIATSDKRWNITILRYFNPCGAHSSGKLGELRTEMPKNLMPCICHAAAGRLSKVTIYGSDYDTQDGTAVKGYTHVVDLAQGHIKAIQRVQSNGQNYQVYNLGADKLYSVMEMVKAFEKISGKQIPVELCPRKLGEVDSCVADSSKAWKELGWKAERSLQQMCEDMWRWINCDDKGDNSSTSDEAVR